MTHEFVCLCSSTSSLSRPTNMIRPSSGCTRTSPTPVQRFVCSSSFIFLPPFQLSSHETQHTDEGQAGIWHLELCVLLPGAGIRLFRRKRPLFVGHGVFLSCHLALSFREYSLFTSNPIQSLGVESIDD